MLRLIKQLVGFAVLFALIAASADAIAKSKPKKIYVWQDENGVLVFSDTPKTGAEEVSLKTNSLNMPAQDTSILETSSNDPQAVQFKVSIDSPENEGTIRDNTGSVYVTGSVSPRFVQGHKIQLMLDGDPYQTPQARTMFVLRNVDRGEHTLQLRLLDDTGQAIATSDLVTFFLHRRSVITGP